MGDDDAVTIVGTLPLGRLAILAWVPAGLVALVAAAWPSAAATKAEVLVAIVCGCVSVSCLLGIPFARLPSSRAGVNEVRVSAASLDVRFGNGDRVVVPAHDVVLVVWWTDRRPRSRGYTPTELGILTRTDGMLGARRRSDRALDGLWSLDSRLRSGRLKRTLRRRGYAVRRVYGDEVLALVDARPSA